MAVPRSSAHARRAPGPRGVELLHDLIALRRDALWTFVDLTRRYGDIVQASVPGLRLVVVHRPEHAEHVLVTRQDNYPKGPEVELIGAALGEDLLTSRGEQWRRQRRLVQPLFAKRNLEPLVAHMTAAGGDLLADWEGRHADGELVDVGEAMMGLTLDVVGRALFGADLTGDSRRIVGAAIADVLDALMAAGISPLTHVAAMLPGMSLPRALWLRPRRHRRFRAHQARLDAIVADTIAAHRCANSGHRADLLSLLLDARDELGRPLSDREVRDEAVTFLLAGHETTANAMAWMWMLLSRHPAARDRLHAEVDEALGGRIPTFADADRLPWTRAVVQEAMRLYPPVWNVLRHAEGDDVIDGVRIPAGSAVLVLIYLTHRDPTVWPNPEGFDPSRFLHDHAHGRPRHAFLPFAAGRRVCVGNTFAMTEATLLTAMIAQRWVLDLDPTVRIEAEPLLTLRPRDGLRMRLRRRGG